MAESTLSYEYVGLMNSLSYFLHGNASYTTLTAPQIVVLDDIVQRGYRQFLYPPFFQGMPEGYQWTFLKPVTSITTIPTYDTGTVEIATTTCTLSGAGAAWPTWIVDHGKLVVAGEEYSVVSRDSDTVLTIVAGTDVAAGETDWTLEYDNNYDLPDDFGRLINGFTYAPGAQRCDVLADVGEAKIRSNRMIYVEHDAPRIGAIRPKAHTDHSVGQRWELLLYPSADAAYVLEYRYEAYDNKLTTLAPYPLGGMKHGHVLQLSCLAMADAMVNDNYGIHWENFQRQLIAAIDRDQKEQQVFFGNVGCKGEYGDYVEGITRNYTMTINGNRVY